MVWKELVQDKNKEGLNNVWALIIRNFIAFYQGWLIAASNLNLGVVLVYTVKISKKIHLYLFWIIGPLSVAAVLYLNYSIEGSLHSSIGLMISASYALIGAAITSKKCLGGDEQPYLKEKRM